MIERKLKDSNTETYWSNSDGKEFNTTENYYPVTTLMSIEDS